MHSMHRSTISFQSLSLLYFHLLALLFVTIFSSLKPPTGKRVTQHDHDIEPAIRAQDHSEGKLEPSVDAH